VSLAAIEVTSEDIPFAEPFPLGSQSMEQSQISSVRSIRKRSFVGSVLAVLQQECLGRKSKMGKRAKNILRNLFHEHGIETMTRGSTQGLEGNANGMTGTGFPRNECRREMLQPGTEHTEILTKAKEGRYSIFSSVLRVVEAGPGPVPTKQLLRELCLTVRPGDVPGMMDCKDMILAALHFLSSDYAAKSDTLLQLPLIRPTQAYGDLEKRNFEKVGNWKLSEVEDKLWTMERIFLTSPSPWKWQRREVFCPRGLSQPDELSFLSKGTIPSSATAKKPEGTRKRRAPLPLPSNARDKIRQQGKKSLKVVEATIDDTGENSVDDEDPVVEATILDDDS
jgi:hypothetical protein